MSEYQYYTEAPPAPQDYAGQQFVNQQQQVVYSQPQNMAFTNQYAQHQGQYVAYQDPYAGHQGYQEQYAGPPNPYGAPEHQDLQFNPVMNQDYNGFSGQPGYQVNRGNQPKGRSKRGGRGQNRGGNQTYYSNGRTNAGYTEPQTDHHNNQGYAANQNGTYSRDAGASERGSRSHGSSRGKYKGQNQLRNNQVRDSMRDSTRDSRYEEPPGVSYHPQRDYMDPEESHSDGSKTRGGHGRNKSKTFVESNTRGQSRANLRSSEKVKSGKSKESDCISAEGVTQSSSSEKQKGVVLSSHTYESHRDGWGKGGGGWRGRGKGARGTKQSSGCSKKEEEQESQRGSLIEQLSNNTYECMVCCEIVRKDTAVWSCDNCFHVFHLRCIKKWACTPNSSIEGEGGGVGWRCPACQNVTKVLPSLYKCFCGQITDPEYTRYDTPHSCGEVCSKGRPAGCTHPCNILCHPGPCPPCHASVVKNCDCGKTQQTVRCGLGVAVRCEKTCERGLNCGQHVCHQVCHSGPCQPCEDVIHQKCYCGQDEREVVCGSAEGFTPSYSCLTICNRPLDCEKHNCDRQCHPGACEGCQQLPDVVLLCPCEKTPICELPEPPRQSCTDPIPTCSEVCGKELACGPKGDHHHCSRVCHEGACGACAGNTPLTCRCQAYTKEMSCEEAACFSDTEPFLCERRCNKKRQCGKHKCGIQCCVETTHNCVLVCGRKLSCGLHRCEEPCHRGNCSTCWHVSFEELSCECGAEILYPPVACGIRPPECGRKCTRQHPCTHQVQHNCHSDERCPPCTALTEKWCLGKHELRKNIPCHRVDVTCGLPCGSDLPCGQHHCQLTCHKGGCLGEGSGCQQPCLRPREACAHPCGAPCHGDKPCPHVSCKAETVVYCPCGLRSEKALCNLGGDEHLHDYQNLATSLLAMRMTDAQQGQAIDISNLTKESGRRKPRTIDCTSECSQIERNRRLALALEIRNPDVTGKLGTPAYTTFLKDFAKQNLRFVSGVEKALSDLVMAAQQSKKSKRSHAFTPMSSVQRRLVHELAEFYGCQSQSYDEEPKKNVVTTAEKGKCWAPTTSLTSLVQRDLHPKAPMPMPLGSKEEDLRTRAQLLKKSTDVGAAWGGRSKGPVQTTDSPWVSKPQVLAPAAPTRPFPWGTTPAPAPTAAAKPDAKSGTAQTKKSDSPVFDYFDMM